MTHLFMSLTLSALFLTGCLSSDDKDNDSPTGPQDEAQIESDTPAENDSPALSGALVATMTVHGVSAQVSCSEDQFYGVSTDSAFNFNVLNHSSACTGDAGTWISVINFPTSTTQGLTGAADVIIQAKSVANLIQASSGAQVSLVVESWDTATKHLKATLDYLG